MRIRGLQVIRAVLLGIGMVAGMCALAMPAGATVGSVGECGPRPQRATESVRPLAVHSSHLVARDGTGFFTKTISTLAVRGASERDGAVAAATIEVGQALVDFYFGSDVEVFVNQPGKSTRAVMVDRAIGVPHQPAVFSIDGVETLYLHATTAADDVARLLDAPAFEAVVICDDPSGTTRAEDLGPAALLAFVDEDPSPGSASRVPLADSTPRQQWPLGVSVTALTIAAAGVVVHQRDRILGRGADASPPPVFELLEKSNLLESDELRLPIPDLPRALPRVIFLEEGDHEGHEPARTLTQREIDLHAKASASQLTRLVDKIAASSTGPVLSSYEFARRVNIEWSRHQDGGEDGAVASLVLSELDAVRLRLGNHAAEDLFTEVALHIASISRPLDVIGLASENELAILMPDVDEEGARAALDEITKAIASTNFTALGERVFLTPATGFALLSDTESAPDLIRAIESARALSMLNLHLDPERWDANVAPPDKPAAKKVSVWTSLKEKLRTPSQIALTFVLGWGVPFLGYWVMHWIGIDFTLMLYLFFVSSLVLTGAFILAEGMMAIKQKEPPELAPEAFPKATALIAAYMPNEAATVIETIEAFLAIDYPNELQIILAYNTPDPMPVEEELDRIAGEHPNFVPVRIVGSTSKAQNVNAALSMAEGAFIGMFDADHQPRPDAFRRAWRWIDAGYDVVQGHCLTRNGDASWLAKMIAVEFESIYSVAHPGRAKMHHFGVFGGSNGFWRTELLHETRMKGSMLTEDIDSSLRVVERGFKIRSDRDLVSRELATTTMKQVWNQRMRWAQGWFQVSMVHARMAYRSKNLTLRQKLGVFHLLAWREVYPWLSQQLFPLIAFWAIQAGGITKLDWTIPIFVATSIFTFSVGPLQCVFAYKLADPEIKQHKKWFWGYLLFATPFYTEYKNLISRVAHVKEFMGESDWRVTPRE